MRYIYLFIATLLLNFHTALAEMRIWTFTDGKSVEAEYVTTIGGLLVFKDKNGKNFRIEADMLDDAGRRYMDLSNPPGFNISFRDSSKTIVIEMDPYFDNPVPNINDYTFSVTVKQKGTVPYNYELTIEYFAIGAEVSGNNYILLQRNSSSFTPSAENNYSHTFSGKRVEMMEYIIGDQARGRKYKGYLVVITDCEGRVIAHETSNEFLFENLEKLRQIPERMFFDKNCDRVRPTRPKRSTSTGN